METVKIKVPENKSWEDVVAYMQSLGYRMIDTCEKEYENKAHYYGDEYGCLSQTGKEAEEFYQGHGYKEIFLPEDNYEPVPIGLRPKAIVNALRIAEILEAMMRYQYAGKAFPQEWIDELSVINSEREDYEG